MFDAYTGSEAVSFAAAWTCLADFALRYASAADTVCSMNDSPHQIYFFLFKFKNRAAAD